MAVLGKAEGLGTEWHGHVTAITVAPEYRRLSLARKMMNMLEHVSDHGYKGYFVDLYVRCTNTVAIGMYERFGYSVYRRVREYYGSLGKGREGKDEEDAYGACLHLAIREALFPVRRRRGSLLTYCSTNTDMRKPLSLDPHRRSVRANGREFVVSASDVS